MLAKPHVPLLAISCRNRCSLDYNQRLVNVYYIIIVVNEDWYFNSPVDWMPLLLSSFQYLLALVRNAHFSFDASCSSWNVSVLASSIWLADTSRPCLVETSLPLCATKLTCAWFDSNMNSSSFVTHLLRAVTIPCALSYTYQSDSFLSLDVVC